MDRVLGIELWLATYKAMYWLNLSAACSSTNILTLDDPIFYFTEKFKDVRDNFHTLSSLHTPNYFSTHSFIFTILLSLLPKLTWNLCSTVGYSSSSYCSDSGMEGLAARASHKEQRG